MKRWAVLTFCFASVVCGAWGQTIEKVAAPEGHASVLSAFESAQKNFYVIGSEIARYETNLQNINKAILGYEEGLSRAKVRYAEALDNFNLYENTITKNFGLSTVYDNLGLIEELKGDYKLAEEYYLNSYQLRKKKSCAI